MTKALSNEQIRRMRELKAKKVSLKEIAAIIGCAKSTVSMYCRDLYENPNRKYSSEKEVRKAIVTRRQGRSRNRTLYDCLDACGKKVRTKDTRCNDCHRRYLTKLSHKEYLDKTFPTKKERQIGEFVPPEKPKPKKITCKKSPSGAHFWYIKPGNVGECRYCHEEKQFSGRASPWEQEHEKGKKRKRQNNVAEVKMT